MPGRMARVAGLSVLWLAGVAQAAQWREVGEVPDTGTIVYVDESSVMVDHDTFVKGWVKLEYDKPRMRNGQKVEAIATHRMVNCEVNRYWQMDEWGYRSDADPVRFYSGSQEWDIPAPDSDSEVASAVICNAGRSFLGVIWDQVAIAQRLQMVWRLITAALSR